MLYQSYYRDLVSRDNIQIRALLFSDSKTSGKKDLMLSRYVVMRDKVNRSFSHT